MNVKMRTAIQNFPKYLALMIPRAAIIRVISQLLQLFPILNNGCSNVIVAFLLLVDVFNVVAVVVVEADSQLWVPPNNRGRAVGY